MDFPVTRNELTKISGIGRTTTYKLQAKGELSPPREWCGKAMFCLKDALHEIAQVNGLPAPSAEAMHTHWSLIFHTRSKKIP